MIGVSNLTMRFGKQILFEDVSIKFKPNCRYGLIGANGSGKSTFMKILTGQMKATSGEVSVDRNCTVGFLKQDHFQYDNETIIDTVFMGNEKLWSVHKERDYLYSKEELTDEEEDRCADIEEEYEHVGGYTMESDAAKLLEGLGIVSSQHYEKMSSLTGGFKLRVLLAQVLFASPDILLMDEPTNHLDMASRNWLEDLLNRYTGTVVVISHDRYFLNSVCSHIADLDYNKIRMFTGNYDDFMIASTVALEQSRKEQKKQEKRISELRTFINRFSANASKAKQATSRQKELNKIQISSFKPSSRVSPYICFEPKNRLGDKVIDTDKIAVRYDNLEVFKNYSTQITDGEKIAIIGVNGAGKTTLLKALLGMIKVDSGAVELGETVEFSYFPQDSADVLTNPNIAAIDWLSSFVRKDEGMTETEIRSAMGKMLFKGDEVTKPIKVLSGGEKARLIIARMLLEGGNVLILDEPTNHLDLESIEALNYSLTVLEETVIFVSHDRQFVDSLATRIIEIDNGEIVDYPGTLKEFYSWKNRNKKKGKK